MIEEEEEEEERGKDKGRRRELEKISLKTILIFNRRDISRISFGIYFRVLFVFESAKSCPVCDFFFLSGYGNLDWFYLMIA